MKSPSPSKEQRPRDTGVSHLEAAPDLPDQRRRSFTRRAPRDVSDDAAVAADRRQGTSAQASESHLLPDQRRRSRSGSRRGRPAPQTRARLVLSLLSGPRALPGARSHALRDVPHGSGRRRPTRPAAGVRCPRIGGTAGSTSSRSPAPPAPSACRRSGARTRDASTSVSPKSRIARLISSATRSCMSRSATAPRAKANSGNR